jgi:hypothetical protein
LTRDKSRDYEQGKDHYGHHRHCQPG